VIPKKQKGKSTKFQTSKTASNQKSVISPASMAPKPALLWCVRIVLILHACFLVIRLGLASHIVRILTKCQADRSKCDDVNDETNAASLSLAWAVVVAATAGIAAAATVIGNGWLWNLQKDLWGVKACVPVVLVAWCLDAICLGLSVKEVSNICVVGLYWFSAQIRKKHEKTILRNFVGPVSRFP